MASAVEPEEHRLVAAPPMVGRDFTGRLPEPGSRWRTSLVAVGAALLLAAAVIAGWTQLGSSTDTRTRASAPNLIPNGGFEIDKDLNGVADGLVSWGASRLALVRSDVAGGGRAQQLAVASGAEGGMWFEVPVHAGRRYTQSAILAVNQRQTGTTIDMILEWYDAGGRLLDYRLLPTSPTGHTAVRYSQTAQAPPRAVSVRFVINVAGGGSVVVDKARLARA